MAHRLAVAALFIRPITLAVSLVGFALLATRHPTQHLNQEAAMATRLTNLVHEAERNYDGSCVLYFAQAGEYGPIKIGITSAGRLSRRIEELQNGCPWRVELRKVVAGSRRLERALHRTAAPWRMNGEWFYPDPALARLAGATHQAPQVG